MQKLRHAKEAAAKAICLADDVATLYDWLRQDILAVAGPDYPTRRELLDFVVGELLQREPQCEHRIGPIRTMLVNQGSDFLAFAAQLDKDLAALAATHQVSEAMARAILQIQQMSKNDRRRWPRGNAAAGTGRAVLCPEQGGGSIGGPGGAPPAAWWRT